MGGGGTSVCDQKQSCFRTYDYSGTYSYKHSVKQAAVVAVPRLLAPWDYQAHGREKDYKGA